MTTVIRKNTWQLIRNITAGAMVVALTFVNASAAPITWGTPVTVDVNAPTQVSTNGTLIVASASTPNGSNPWTVNGVTFSGTFVGLTTNYSGFNDNHPFGPNTTDYSKMLGSGIYRASGANATTSFSALTNGQLYEIQVFVPFWDVNYGTRLISGSNTVDMGNTSSVAKYVTGTFTASGTTQSFDWTASSGSDYGLLAATQIRQIPEPGTVFLVGASGFLALCLRRRRA